MEARKILLLYFPPHKDIMVGPVRERGLFFEAEITDRKGRLIDVLIIDKRTGRIRSVY